MPGNAERWASLAAEKLTAKSVEAGQYDLILEPTNLWLTIHESIGHPTELDRAIGEEANYAGTSFVAPPEKTIGKLKYGPEFMNIQADRTQEGSLVARRVGRRRRAGRPVADHREGHLQGLPDDARAGGVDSEAHRRARDRTAARSPSRGTRVQFQRMPNISLLPGEQDIALDDIVAATDRGIVIKNRGSWSIDHQRYNFQFSGQAFYEVRNGKIVGMLRDVAYQSNTPVFWNSMDMIGGKSSYWLGGAFNDGKGEPSQINSVSHGCVPARFRNVNDPQHGRTHERQTADVTLSRDEAKALADRVLAFSKGADQTRVNITSELERQHALRRREHHDVGRHHRHRR